VASYAKPTVHSMVEAMLSSTLNTATTLHKDSKSWGECLGTADESSRLTSCASRMQGSHVRNIQPPPTKRRMRLAQTRRRILLSIQEEYYASTKVSDFIGHSYTCITLAAIRTMPPIMAIPRIKLSEVLTSCDIPV
jgi:hypothetical protein